MKTENFYYKSKYTIPFKPYITEPYISANVHEEHYNGHFLKCKEMLIKILDQKQILQSSNIKEIIVNTYGKFNHMKEWQYASLLYAHMVMWDSLCAPNTTQPNEHTMKFINKSYGDIENMRLSVIQKCSELVGSGWCFIILNRDNEIHTVVTINAFTPVNIRDTVQILLAIDLWEHAFYKTYGPNKIDYVKDLFDNILNWDRVNTLLSEH